MAFWREGAGGVNCPTELFGANIPTIIPPSGTIGNNGALSLLATALPLQYLSCYMYFPVNAIAAGVAAGFYYVVMSSTTAGTIYNNTLDYTDPSIPASPTAFVTTGPGAYVQTTAADITMASYILKGGRMGLHSLINSEAMFSYPNSAGAKTLKQTFGAQVVQQYAPTTSLTVAWHSDVFNRGHLARQGHTPFNLAGHSGASAGAVGNISVDTTADVTIAVTGQLAAAADFIILQRLHLELS